jgi:O-antigen/teichoic acid export membrane protein
MVLSTPQYLKYLKFMERSSLTFQTLKNISYSVVGYLWPMIFTLFVTPILIFKLGIKNYGIYLFVNTAISLLGILDFGISIAVTKYMAYYHGQKNEEAIATLSRSANSLFLIISFFGFLALSVIALFGAKLLPAQFANYAQYSPLFLLAGGIFFANNIDTTYTVTLNAFQRFDISNKIGIISITISSLSMLVAVLLGGSLQIIFLILLIISILFAFITFYSVKKILPQASFRFGWDREEVKKCYRFGVVTSINNIANTALSSLDRLIIPFFAGPSNLTYYSVPGNVTMRIPSFANTFSTTLFPMASQLDGKKDKAKIETFYIRSFRLITIIASALTITAVAFAYKILLYWLNADFASHSTDILIILAFTNFILALFGPLSAFLLGLGKLKFLTIMSVMMSILNVILLCILLPLYGITGAAWAYLLSVVPVAYMFYYTEKNYLALSYRKKYYTKKIAYTFITSCIVWIVDVFLLSPLVVNLTTLVIIGGVSVLGYLLLYRLFGFFEEEDWKDFDLFYGEILKNVIQYWRAIFT